MTVISKLAVSTTPLIFKLKPNASQVLAIRNAGTFIFKKRPGQLYINRLKDVLHFYTIGIGILPLTVLLVVVHLFYGSACELTDYPTDGTVPHYWQFERTPLRQFWAKYCGISDAEHHERTLAWHDRNTVVARWRKAEDRVKHLQGERWDYKGWYHESVSSTWVDYSRFIGERLRNEYEEHGHYNI